MKKIFVAAFMLFLFHVANSQVMSNKPQTIIIKSANLRCWECKERLDKYLLIQNKSYLESGIIEWKIDLLKGELKIKFLPDRVTIDDIKAAINNGGFDADEEKAEPDAYKKLPSVCKRAEDGGGPKKGMPCHNQPY